MRLRPFGAPERLVSAIGQGTWQMEGDARSAAVEALRRGLDAGLRHVDTAEMYGEGRVEELVGACARPIEFEDFDPTEQDRKLGLA